MSKTKQAPKYTIYIFIYEFLKKFHFSDKYKNKCLDFIMRDIVVEITNGMSNAVTTDSDGNVSVGVDILLFDLNAEADLVIADVASYTVSLTGYEGLTNAVSSLELFSLNLSGQVFDLTDQEIDNLLNLLFQVIENILGESGVLNVLLKTLTATQELVDLGVKGILIASSAMTIEANIEAAAKNLSKICNNDVTYIPDAKGPMEAISASVKDNIVATYNDLKEKIVDKYNSLICTSCDTTIDNILVSVNAILDELEPLIDPYLAEYTGHTITEVKYICNAGFALVNMLKRTVQMSKQAIALKKALTENTSVNTSINITVSVNNIKQTSKDRFIALQQDYSKEEIKSKFLEWLGALSIVIRNAFSLVLIKDTIAEIKETCKTLLNNGILNLADFLNALDIVNQVFKMIGYDPYNHKDGIKFTDLADLAAKVSATAIASGKDMLDLVESNAKATLQYAYSKYLSAKNKAKDEAENAANNATSTATDAANNATATTEYTGEIYTYNEEFQDKYIIIDVWLYADPAVFSSDIRTFIYSFVLSNGKKVFSNAKTKAILDYMKDAWDDDEVDYDFTISALVDGITKKYKFIVNSNKEEYTKWLNETNQSINAGEVVGSTTSSAMNMATDAASDAADEVSNLLKNAAGSLTNGILNIDLTLIESYFADRVLMFDFIVKMLDTLWPIWDILAQLCKLLQYYKVNKEFILNKQHVGLAKALRDIALNVENLKGIISLENTNFFLVRTESMSNWLKNEFNATPGEDGMSVLTIPETAVLYAHCAEYGINPETQLSLVKGTTLCFNTDKKPDGSEYKDCTTNGIDNVIINQDLNEVYYDTDRRSTIASLIMRAKSKGYDPYKTTNYVLTEDSSYDVGGYASLLKSIEVYTDEYEGLQVIDLNNLNLCCSATNLEDVCTDEVKYYTIIEFGDEYTGGDAVDFKWNVYPGLVINENTIIAYQYEQCEQNSVANDIEVNSLNVNKLTDESKISGMQERKSYPLKSMFSKATVVSNNELLKSKKSKDFYQLFPGYCKSNRHICLADVSYGNPTSFNYEDILEITDKMKESDLIFNFIISNMIPSVFPNILAKANRDLNNNFSNAYNGFTVNIDTFNNEMSSKALEMIDKTDSISATKGNPKLIEQIGNLMLDVKNQMFAYSKNLYNDINNNQKYNGFVDCSDTKALAQYTNTLYKGNENIGNSDYDNYYMYLLSNVDLLNKCKFSLQYYDLLSNIITNRVTKTQVPSNVLMLQFNTLYKEVINNSVTTGYSKILNSVKPVTYDNVFLFLKRNIMDYKIASNDSTANMIYDSENVITVKNAYSKITLTNDTELMSAFYNKYDSIIKQSSNYEYKTYDGVLKLMSNLFVYIKNEADLNNLRSNKSMTANEYLQLVKDESLQLESFWNNVLSEYESNYAYDVLIQEFKDYANDITQYLDWPTPVEFNIGNNYYKLYTFLNKKKQDENVTVDLGDVNFGDYSLNPTVDVSVDINMSADIRKPEDTTFTDYKYWLVYMANATMLTLLPTYWADGFDVPPDMTPTLMPAIYFPIAPPLNVPYINITLVFGLAIRGIYCFPIALMINLNNHPINVMIPAIVALQWVKNEFDIAMTTIENGIPQFVKQEINNLVESNAELRNVANKFRTYASVIKAIPIEDQALIEEEFMAAVHDVEEEYETKKELRKAERNAKKRDKRQVITREEDLGTGQEPL